MTGKHAPVASRFFAKPSQASTSQLKQQTSVISLSDDSDDGDGEVQIIGQTQGSKTFSTVPLKRSADAIKSTETSDAPSKQIKVAPLFERKRSTVEAKAEETTNLSLQALQQWKFSAQPSQSAARQDAPTSSPLPELPRRIRPKTTTHQASIAGRTISNGSGTRSGDELGDRLHEGVPGQRPDGFDGADDVDISEEQDEHAENSDGNDQEGTTFSNRIQSRSAQQSTSAAISRLSKFAASGSDDSDAARGKKTRKGKGRATAAVPDDEAVYTPLEKQYMEIKQKYVWRHCPSRKCCTMLTF